MGFPIQNNYSLLRILSCDNDIREDRLYTDKNGKDLFKESLSKFNLFAFVIHDPHKHKEFDNYLNSNFDRLDHSTGHKLLFFALISLSKDQKEEYSKRDYHNLFSSVIAGNGYYFENSVIVSENDSIIPALSSTLNIPEENFPVILVTNNFSNKDFYWIKTEEDVLDRQLSELGYIAKKYPETADNWSVAKIILKDRSDKFDVLRSFNFGNTIESLAKSLSDLLSLIIISNRELNEDNLPKYELENAQIQAKESIAKLEKTLVKYRKQNTDEEIQNEEVFDQVNKNIVSFLSLISRNYSNNLDFELKIPEKFLESDSSNLLKASQKVLNALLNDDQELHNILGSTNNYDYSPVGICFTKLFEIEISLSIVHWIRQLLGVHLPDYYKKYEEKISANYIPDNLGIRITQKINFNKMNEKDFRWEPPAIGMSRVAFNSIRLKENYIQDFNYIDHDKLDIFIHKWKELTELRNTCAHVEPVSIDSVKKIIELLNEMNEIGIFEKLNKMKIEFRSIN